MNPQLHEMMMEATKDMPPGYYVPGEYFEKFALLIVEECMEQLNISNVPAPISAGLNLGRVAIKEHFGV